MRGNIKLLAICNHYNPAEIYIRSDTTISLGIFGLEQRRKKSKSAYSVVQKISDNEYKCLNCGAKLNKKQNARINDIVDYLNSGGDSDKKLMSLYKGIPVAQKCREGFKTYVEIIEAPKGYIPIKNEVNYYK